MMEKETKMPNKTLKVIGNIGFAIFMIVMTILIFITVQSKLTGKEPSILSHKLYIVDSGSMSPTIKEDSMIIVKEEKPEEIKEKDIITYYGYENSRVTHRVIEVQNQGEFFITRGDANDSNDPFPLEGKKLIGKVVYIIPLVGGIFRFIRTDLGIGLLIILGVIWIVLPKVLQRISI